jgi:hypothetical protein
LNRRSFLASLFAQTLNAQPASHRGFRDVAQSAGVRFRNCASHTSQKYLPETMCGGVAMFDYDNDGWLDLFFVNGAALQDPMRPGALPDKHDPRFWNRLYRNNRDGTFTDVTEKAGLQGFGYGMGVAVGDYNNDGFADLYVTALGGNALYRNNGDGTFSDVTPKAAVAGSGWSTGACFVDFDRDGLLDLVVARYLDWSFDRNPYCGEKKPGYRSYCHPDQFNPIAPLVFRNNGDGTFSDVSLKSGLGKTRGKALGIAINDFDQDGWPDLVIANDSFPQQLFRNNRDGTFSEVALDLGLAYDDDGRAFAGMGVDFADYDNDGWPDIFINSLPNQRYALYRNRGGKSFDYMSGASGLSATSLPHSGWGAKFIDYDNDGWKDLFVAQGHVMDNIELTQPGMHFRENLLLLHNERRRFADVSKQAGPAFQIPFAARGAAFGDFNNDGSVDIAVNCNDGPAVVLMNQGRPGHHWLILKLAGTKSNRDGIGARVRVTSESGLTQYAFVSTAASYLSASDRRVHFGLGTDRGIKELRVDWPSGATQRLNNVLADQTLAVTEPSA